MLKKQWTVGIIGAGIVGTATGKVFACNEMIYYDKYREGMDDVQLVSKMAETADFVFICVPTPMKTSGEIDYSAINDSVALLADAIDGSNSGPVVIIRSTTVSGTTHDLSIQYPNMRFVFNPEFLVEKTANSDAMHPKRIIIGVDDVDIALALADFYRDALPGVMVVTVGTRTAEMIKYASNTFLACQVAVANELYKICEAVGVDYDIVREALLYDKRIGTHNEVPGPDGELGFGGKCFPKDLNAAIYFARENGYRPYLLEEVWRLNLRLREKRDWEG